MGSVSADGVGSTETGLLGVIRAECVDPNQKADILASIPLTVWDLLDRYIRRNPSGRYQFQLAERLQ